MKNIYYKFKNWYRGYKPYSIEEMLELQRPRYLKEKESIPDKFDPPFVAKVLNSIGRFWLRNWQFLIKIIIAIISLSIATTGLYLKLKGKI